MEIEYFLPEKYSSIDAAKEFYVLVCSGTSLKDFAISEIQIVKGLKFPVKFFPLFSSSLMEATVGWKVKGIENNAIINEKIVAKLMIIAGEVCTEIIGCEYLETDKPDIFSVRFKEKSRALMKI